MLGYEALQGVLGMRDAIDLLEQTLAHEAEGKTRISSKIVTSFKGGAMRTLFAADYLAGYLTTKAYHSIEGVGVRYVVTLYSLHDGELLALLDGQTITDLRTGAASGVMARKVPISGPVTVGVIGSGNQARTQLESISTVYNVKSAVVYSPTPSNREVYAREMSARLGFAVTAVDSAKAAAKGREVVVAASSARGVDPVLRGEWLNKCRLLCAVGNTRPQYAEADVQCFRDASVVVMDTLHALKEAGDLLEAVKSGALPLAKQATLAQIVSGAVTAPRTGLVTFKSVGSALQDLSLAARYYELVGKRPGLPSCPDLASLR